MVDTPSNTLLLDLVQSVGRTEGKLDMLLAEQGRASATRNEMYRAIEQAKESASQSLEHSKTAARDVAEMKPKVERLEKRQHQAEGAAWLVRILWTAVAGLAAALAYIATKLGIK